MSILRTPGPWNISWFQLHAEIFAVCLRLNLECEWGKTKREESSSEGKKEAWLSAQEAKKFEVEWRENLAKMDKDSCLGHLRCLHSIRNHEVLPRRAETVSRLKKKKVEIKIAVLQDTNLKNCMGELRFSKLISAMASDVMRIGKLLISKYNR